MLKYVETKVVMGKLEQCKIQWNLAGLAAESEATAGQTAMLLTAHQVIQVPWSVAFEKSIGKSIFDHEIQDNTI